MCVRGSEEEGNGDIWECLWRPQCEGEARLEPGSLKVNLRPVPISVVLKKVTRFPCALVPASDGKKKQKSVSVLTDHLLLMSNHILSFLSILRASLRTVLL